MTQDTSDSARHTPAEVASATLPSQVSQQHAASTRQTRVFYDGACPLCRREIALLKSQDKAGALDCLDISELPAHAEVAPGLTRETALQRMHVQLPDGSVASGARAFFAMWERIWFLRPVVAVLRIPPLPWVLERAYNGFLKVRPRLQRALRNREAKAARHRA